MKLSKIMHVGSVIVGFIGVITFIGTLISGGDNLVFVVTEMDGLACDAILILIATWLQVATIHHMMLEKKGEIV
jgi:hypothetical protein